MNTSHHPSNEAFGLFGQSRAHDSIDAGVNDGEPASTPPSEAADRTNTTTEGTSAGQIITAVLRHMARTLHKS